MILYRDTLDDMRESKGKLEALDYAFLFGLPVLFLLVAWFGLTSFLPKAPPPDPVKRLRDGAISIAMTEPEVAAKLGDPKSIQELPDGGRVYIYQRTVFDGDVATDEGLVEFAPTGRVRSIRFERVGGPPPETPK